MIINRNKLMRNPEGEYLSPRNIVEHPELAHEQKIQLLMNWRNDLLELQRANGENMQKSGDDSGDIAEDLKTVTDALLTLDADPSTGQQH